MTYEQWQTTDDFLSSYIRERELAARWRRSLRTVQRMRIAGNGPPYLRIGEAILYHIEDVVAFENARRIGGEAAQ
ncbi:helix-turn-helix transcriptional regulator [Oceanibium sediminis]|uniref:helix-turn-helix transcriptional regulator n=1 Tax=Oceanibium sediminis TaxID=2026339 RepID=UPI000DD45152|nr:DNA-binding protein [Oceanibium sediminis]